MKALTITITACSMLLCASVFAQYNPLISQYLDNGLPLNPAFTGSRDALSASLSYRNQWVGLDGSPETQTLSVHTPLRRDAVAVGAVVYRNSIGLNNEIGVMASAAYRLKIDRNQKIAFGLAGGLLQKRSEWSKINTEEPGDEIFEGGNASSILPNVSAGIYYYSDKAYISYSLPFILEYGNSQGKIQAKHAFVRYNHQLGGGAELDLSKKFKIRPSTMFHYIVGQPLQMDLNVLVHDPDLAGLGLSYRLGDALIATAQIHATKQLTVIYSFEYGISQLRAYHKDTHEFTIRYDLRFFSKAKSPKFF